MRPISKQPCRSYATGKTRKFNLLDEITIGNLKFFTKWLVKSACNAKKIIIQLFSDAQSFLSMLKDQI